MSRDVGCGSAIPQCHGTVCTIPRRRHGQVTPAQLATGLHSSAAMLVEDVDFDLYDTRDFPHLIRDADIVVRDVIEVRRALSRHESIQTVAAGLRNAAASLRHLDRAIGRRYRTRAIHFSLLDTEIALTDLAVNLNVDLSGEASPSEPTRSAPQHRPHVGASRESTAPLANPQSERPPAPPEFQTQPELPQTAPQALVIPEQTQRLTIPDTMKGIRKLDMSDQQLAMRQRTCPVTGDLLGSMGKPIKVSVDGRAVFVCCQGCVEEVRSSLPRPS